MRLTKSQELAIHSFRKHAHERKDNAASTIKYILKMSNIEPGRFNSAIEKLKNNVRIVFHFHPDRLDADMNTVASSLLNSGYYKSQFETKISNGSVSAHPGGERDLWEKELYRGAFHQGEFNIKERPKYGALDLFRHEDGPAPGFGSCYFILRSEVNKRSTYTYLDSHNMPEQRGTYDQFDDIISALLLDIFKRDFALGESNINVTKFVKFIEESLDEYPFEFKSNSRKRNLNHYIEVQAHGDISLKNDVEYVVIDPSFKGTKVGSDLAQLSQDYDIKLKYHPGFKLNLEDVPLDFRGPTMPSLAKKVIGDKSYLTTNLIGDSARSLKENPDLWSDRGSFDEVLQELKLLWHVLANFGSPLEDS